MMTLIFEEVVKDVKTSIKAILRFLGCSALFDFNMENKVYVGNLSVTQYVRAIKTNRYPLFDEGFNNLKTLMKDKILTYPLLKRKTRTFLLELYRDEINELEILLKKDLSVWRK